MSAPDRRLIAILAGCAALVIGALTVASWLYATAATGSGGIGSVSAGLSEAFVELVLGVVVVMLLGGVVFVLGRGRRKTG